ncbi:MAG: GAF domain-containing protein, partial [Anaerolineae bacterium]
SIRVVMKPDLAPAQGYRELWGRRRDELAALLWLSNELLSSLEPRDIMKCATKVAVEVLDADRCSIFLPDPLRQELVLRAGYGWGTELFGTFRIKFGVDTAAGHAVAERTPVVVPDMTREDRFSVPEMFIKQGLRSALSTPMLIEGRPIGAMLINTHDVRRFTEAEVKLLSLIANQTAIALENARLYDAAQHKAQQFRLINKVGRRITSILNVDELINEVARLTQETFGYYNVNIGLVEGDYLVIRASEGEYEPSEPPVGQRGLIGDGAGIARWVAAHNRPLLVNDVSQEPRYRCLEALCRTCAELAVPIRISDKVLGVLDVESDRINAFDARDIPLLESLAAQVAVALENARLYEAEQRARQSAETLQKIARILTVTLDLEDALDRILVELKKVIAYDSAAVLLVRYDRLEVVASQHVADVDPDMRVALPIDDPFFQQVSQSEQPLVLKDAQADPRFTAAGQTGYVRGWVCAPLVVKDSVIGCLTVDSRQVGAYNDTDGQTIATFARQAAIAIENARLWDELRRKEEMRGWLIEKIISAQEDERRRVSRELHDDTGQSLTSLAMLLRVLEEQARGLPIESQITDVRDLASTIRDGVHRLAQALRPSTLDQMGLIAAIREHLRQLQQQFELDVSFTIEGFDQDGLDCGSRLPPQVEITLYRIVQEALNNVIKHANADQVAVSLSNQGDRVVATVSDNGRGFDADAVLRSKEVRSLGLLGMRERTMLIDGKLIIDSAPGQGTTIRVEAPLVTIGEVGG